MKNLEEQLKEYGKSDFYPFHMPGHKRCGENADSPYSYDITEIDGFDNLYEAEGLLKEGMERAAVCYGADETFYLVNGSTCGIMVSIFATLKQNDKILMARNCHKSAYKSVYLRGAIPEYIYPKVFDNKGIYCSISKEEVDEKLNGNKDIKAVLITSPTYEGVVSDIKGIAEVVHKHNAVLIIDEAHGSHLGFHSYFPESAVKCGADIVVQSLHKTMKGLTQTGLLHIIGNRVNKTDIKKYLEIFQTSSPSYVLMSSIDKCVCELLEYGSLLFEKYVENLKKFKKNVENFTNIQVFNVENCEKQDIFDFDCGKLLIFPDSKNKEAKDIYSILRDKYHLQPEMVGEKHVLAMTSLSDTEEGFDRLYKALDDIDREIRIEEVYFGGESSKRNCENRGADIKAIVRMSPKETDYSEKETIGIKDAVGRISCEYIYMYPPGIPIVAPGEMITKEIVDTYFRYIDKGYNIYGPKNNKNRQIIVIKENFKFWDFKQV